MITKTCSRERCYAGERVQPIEEFKENGREYKLCATCRKRSRRYYKRRKNAGAASKAQLHGTKNRRLVRLAHHQYLLEAEFWSKFGWYKGMTSDNCLKLLRDPATGRPVAREHADLKPWEVSLVLE